MKIMMFNTLYYPFKVGGAEVSVKLLAESLVKKGHEVQVVSITNENQRKVTLIEGVTSVCIPNTNIYWPFVSEKRNPFQKLFFHIKDNFNFSIQKAISAEIQSFKPDIVHTNNLFGLSTLTWLTCARNSVRVVHTTRDYYLLHINASLYKNGKNINPCGIQVKLLSFFKAIMSKRVAAFVGISEYMMQLHQKNGFAKHGIHTTIYNTVTKQEVKRKSDEQVIIGFFGRLTVEKGFDTFCKIAHEHQNNQKKIKFIAAGPTDSLTEELKAMAGDAGVDLTGFMTLSDFLSTTDLIILPTKWNEPFGRSVVELALAGKPVFTNLTGGTKEIAALFPNIFPLEDFSVSKIYENQQFKIGEGVVEKFSSERICNQYESLYKRVLNNGKN
ncbi:TPA: glycosyltransferase [Escherichia coli]|nr:glycosyltransferase [Escherichia coli]HCN1440886.1 glycosyltransferase [Escherichia coli]